MGDHPLRGRAEFVFVRFESGEFVFVPAARAGIGRGPDARFVNSFAAFTSTDDARAGDDAGSGPVAEVIR